MNLKKMSKAVLFTLVFLVCFITITLIVDIVIDLLSLIIGTALATTLLLICIFISFGIFVYMKILWGGVSRTTAGGQFVYEFL